MRRKRKAREEEGENREEEGPKGEGRKTGETDTVSRAERPLDQMLHSNNSIGLGVDSATS